MLRKIVQIDEERCNGCGLCVPACAEGAIKIINGKAVLAADNLCDGLGACLGECPEGAIKIIEREADGFDEVAVARHLAKLPDSSSSTVTEKAPLEHRAAHHGGCPGSRVMTMEPQKVAVDSSPCQSSQLRQWPVQLHLVPVTAPYLQGADLLICADCVPFAYADFHRDFLVGKVVLVGCPKLDDNSFYIEKLTDLFRANDLKRVTVLRMEVPCCSGIVSAARQALLASGKDFPFEEVVISIGGEIRR
jgi:NAD-dependent dihydropyrimidine dehydrogenase PreA subunit